MTYSNPWPRVTIVTPSYNQAQFLEETIRSVLLQGYSNLEYIIIDGGSTDGSVDIIKKYEPWLAHWECEKDRGQSHAINKGWKMATGDILAWLNSDDVYTMGSIKTAIQCLCLHPESDMVYSDLLIIDEKSNYLRTMVPRSFDLKALLKDLTYIPQPTVFIKRQDLSEVGLLDEDLHYVMDLDLWMRIGLLQNSTILYLDGITLAKWRRHPTAKTSIKTECFVREKLRVWDKIFSNQALPADIAALKSYVYGKTYFENATYAANNLQSSSVAEYFLKALFICPSYALKRPLDSLYLLKQAALGYFHTK
jgi:glycosyltransferase involved in cell wall biosynthesis